MASEKKVEETTDPSRRNSGDLSPTSKVEDGSTEKRVEEKIDLLRRNSGDLSPAKEVGYIVTDFFNNKLPKAQQAQFNKQLTDAIDQMIGAGSSGGSMGPVSQAPGSDR